MAQKPLKKITAAEVMQACGMARQHFYCRFEDLCDAVRRMFDREAIALLRKHEGVMLWEDGLPQLFQYLRENRTVYLWALRSMSRERLKLFSARTSRPSFKTPSAASSPSHSVRSAGRNRLC